MAHRAQVSGAPFILNSTMVRLLNSNWNIDKADNVARFVIAQESMYETALAEIHNGKKKSHWI